MKQSKKQSDAQRRKAIIAKLAVGVRHWEEFQKVAAAMHSYAPKQWLGLEGELDRAIAEQPKDADWLTIWSRYIDQLNETWKRISKGDLKPNATKRQKKLFHVALQAIWTLQRLQEQDVSAEKEKVAKARRKKLGDEMPFVCLECGERSTLGELKGNAFPLYECMDCGQFGGQDGHRCPNCNKFGSKVSDFACPACEQGEMREAEDEKTDNETAGGKPTEKK